ncbi:oligosaccharide flippase family protein [Thiolapillus sp.]
MSTKRHTLYNLAGNILSYIVLLVTVPLYLDLIGLDRYGILSIIWLLLGYFGFFDFGIGRAVAHKIAGLRKGDQDGQKDVLWAGLTSSMPLALAGALILYFVLQFVLGRWISMDAALHEESNAAVIWVALSLLPLVLSSVFNGVLLGNRQFLAINVVDVSTRALLQLLPLAAALIVSPDLASLAQAVFWARVLGLAAWALACIRMVSGALTPRWRIHLVQSLWKYGGWITLSALVGPLLSGLERFFIGNLQGAAAVTLYAVPFSLIAPVVMLAGSLSMALFPRYASIGREGSLQLAQRATGAVIVMITPLMVLLAFLVQPFLAVWISPEFAQKSMGVAQILVVGFWANSLAKVFHTQLQGEGKPHVVAWVHLAELIPFLILLSVLTHQWGISGAAMAWTIRTVVDMGLLGYKSGAWQWRTPLFLAAFLLVTMASVLSYMMSLDLYGLLGVGLPCLMITFWWSWRMGLGGYLRSLVPGVFFK